MKSHLPSLLTLCLTITVLSACSEKEKETDIPLSDVPAEIITITQNTLPGIVLKEAEKKVHDEETIYELEGRLISGEEYEIKITASGRILKIELED